MEFYNSKIQLGIEVIQDVFLNTTPNTKMLVFGLGYDSKMWYENNKNTFFIENNDEYIKLNEQDIPLLNIIKCDYTTTCKTSMSLTDEQIHKFKIPESLVNLAPFDIIIIDGPTGYDENTPGRLIPCFWSTLLSKKGTIIYIDDSSRALEGWCIQKYYKNNVHKIFTERLGCTKIII
jgi:hypothetical protein